ncbi:MAG: LacI family DNA-binding transcriptional regulator [Propionibacteriaceae bacterium]
MRATVRDVAHLAGVSPKTVSNVVNGLVRVSPTTREKVEKALAALDYVPNLSARGLRNGRTGVIALAMPDLSTPYAAEIAHHIVLEAAVRGWSVQIEETGKGSAAREAELLSRASEHLVDGLILNPVLLETSAVQRGVSLPPVVLIGEVDQPIADHVWVDNVTAARAMTELLISSGHRRIAVLGSMRAETARLRTAGYLAALREAGRRRDPRLEIACTVWTAAGAAAAMDQWLQTNEPPDGLFCFTDSMALGALHALALAGLRVPVDVSVVGYDDVPESAYFAPALTTVSFDKRDFACSALDLLADRIGSPSDATVSKTIPFTIVERASVGSR